MILTIARKIFGTRNDRVVRSLRPLVNQVKELGPKLEPLSNAELVARTGMLKEKLAQGASLDDIEAEAYATVREAAHRVLGMRHFDTQIIGGAILHRGKIAEMKTGEGKTLVATLPAYLNALSGNGVHIVTVNDYLAKRDSDWMGQVFRFLGLEVGCVFPGLQELEKRAAYHADITYGQNNEFGFDYLRDNMKYSLAEMCQRDHTFAIVDEVDSILVDEARTPLIISGPIDESTEKYYEINEIIPHLIQGTHFDIDLRTKNPTLNEEGIAKAEELLKVDNLYDPQHIELVHHVNQGLKAHTVFERDVDYVVNDGQIIIVDEFTGRLMAGRRWSNGLHQAVEAKENLQVQRENQTLASITFQNYFRMYKKLSGMTGTADTEAVEFQTIYGLEVAVIPTNRPMVRKDESDLVFRTRKEKYDAVAEDIVTISSTGQPVLVGTISIEQSESLSRILEKRGVPHNVLNAKKHEREAEIVAQAGRLGSVTISTNMAGRGTDIVLGGNPEFLAYAEAGTKDREDSTFVAALAKFQAQCVAEREQVLATGGLAIIGTERHESRRIDNQLRGRAGRQGDPGMSRFYISLEDDLMKRFAGDKMQVLMQRLGWEEGAAMDGRLISHSIETAQKRVEAMHFESRKHVTEYDDVMNRQRKIIYQLRHKVLTGETLDQDVEEMIDDVLEEAVNQVCDEKTRPLQWELDKLEDRFTFLFNIPSPLGLSPTADGEEDSTTPKRISSDIRLEAQAIFNALRDHAKSHYRAITADKESRLLALRSFSRSEQNVIQFSENIPQYIEIERRTILEGVDYFWNNHIQSMEELREGIGLRGYGQKNPLYEYQREGFTLFQVTLLSIKEAVLRRLFYEEILDVEVLLSHIAEEETRRNSLLAEASLLHGDEEVASSAEAEDQVEANVDSAELKDGESARARLESLRRERRKKQR